MASALSYVSKIKSFVILFFTPILLLPLIILMPAKVSCVSRQPGGTRRSVPYNGHGIPGALSCNAPTPPRDSSPEASSRCHMGGDLQRIPRGAETRSQGTRTVRASTKI